MPDFNAEISGLVQRLNLVLSRQDRRSVAFIAANRFEGTSFVARAFASGMAENINRKTLLIDAGVPDRERLTLDGIPLDSGMVESFVKYGVTDKAIFKIEHDFYMGRWLADSGKRGQAAKLAQDADFWKELYATYDIIVIDAPSLQASSDGIALAAQAGAVMLVIEAEFTRQPVIENLRDILMQAGANIAGTVLNKRHAYIPEKIYARL